MSGGSIQRKKVKSNMCKLTIELLDTRGFIFHVDALDIAFHFSDEELGDGTLSLSSLG
jgi:hypothetical protein